MTSSALLAKIEELPPEDRLKVEGYVRSLAQRRGVPGSTKTFPDELLRSINDERDELKQTQGFFNTLPLIREFRETGGR